MSDQETQPDPNDEHDEHDHGPIYIRVFVGLMICTGISTAIGYLISQGMFEGKELIGWGIMLSVSCVKALLVISFFMHLKWERGMWKWVLTIPASIMSLFLILMLVPDIGRRTHYYSDERLDRSPYELTDPAVPVTAIGEPHQHDQHDSE